MYSFDSRVRYSEVDSEGKLSMAALINYFQDCSTFQSEDLNVGIKPLQERHLVWVLSSWQIVVERYPSLSEKVTVGTIPYELKAFLGFRNFLMLDDKGEYVARANSLWSLLDTNTGKPVSIPQDMIEAYGTEEKLEMEYAPRKIAVPKESVACDSIFVRKHHLDTNHHVNNQQFLEMAMVYLPEKASVRQLRAEYKKQAFLGDELVPHVTEADHTVTVSLQSTNGELYMIAEFLLFD